MARNPDAFQSTKHERYEGQAGVAHCKDPRIKELFGHGGVMQSQRTRQKSTKVKEKTKHEGIESPSGTILEAMSQPGEAQQTNSRTQHCTGEDARTLSGFLLHRNHDSGRQPEQGYQ